jgi:hypothetical protein
MQLAALFQQGSIIGFKDELVSIPTYIEQGQQFFCINPLKEQGKLDLANVSEYKNILVEMDSGTIEEQWLHIEASKLPWTTCVYSGGKSLHFIISFCDPIESLEQYNKVALIVCKSLGADTSTVNPNRLSRLANSVRDNNVVQELIEVRSQVSYKEFLNWRFGLAPVELIKKMNKIDEELTKKWFDVKLRAEGARNVLPHIYKNMMESGDMHPECNSRHQSLVKFAIWLKHNWENKGEIEEMLAKAESSLGISGRGDLEGIMKWMN